ncbi:restriction endonuclease subunit S [Aquariibacter albus]|uniref:Restriction endonuclease subunit S n=1 Tax=Aquariibacter albus TaxID=2759899 RepID=A0A839HVS1_9BURK|nr:restriction endonuclease subunit S [Aquariibacter albus]
MFAVRSEPALPTDRMLTASQKYGVLFQSDFMELEARRVVEVIMGTDSLKHVEPDDFIISMRSFQGGIEWCKLRGSTSFHYVMLRPVKHVWPPYFAHLLKSPTYIQALRRTTDLIRDGQELRFSNFAQVDLPVVPLDEQKAIAIFLDRETAKIDALIAEQEKLIARLAEKRRATISHAVTKGLNPYAPMKDSGVEWLGEVPAHWDIVRVKALSQFTTSGPRGWSDRITESGSLFIQSGDLNDSLGLELETAKRVNVGDDAEAARTRLSEGDVVVCITGAKTGNVALCESLPEPAYVNQHLCLVRPSEDVHGRFLALSLKSSVGQTQIELSQYGLKQGLSLENVRELLVTRPPRQEQEAIVEFLDEEAGKLTALALNAAAGVSLLKERRSALIAAAVTGQIDVRNA